MGCRTSPVSRPDESTSGWVQSTISTPRSSANGRRQGRNDPDINAIRWPASRWRPRAANVEAMNGGPMRAPERISAYQARPCFISPAQSSPAQRR
jgi:hypothetical protein